ncbi:MAG TPA: hypothetical protein VFL90_02950 [Methylomirabilota bacterium]|nr:hypothetical protein [Methylomirabilota bacterium]
MKVRSLLFLSVLIGAIASVASAQVILRPAPGPGGNRGVTVIEPTFEPPYRVTIHVYVTAQDGRPLPPPLGANVLVLDPSGRRVGMDESGKLLAEVPNATWGPITNPAPNAPVGPRGLSGSGVMLTDPPDGRYVLEITGTDRVNLDVAIAQWDRAGRRRWMDLTTASTEPGAVDHWDIVYTAAARPALDVVERRDDSYVSIRAYGRSGGAVQDAVTELLLTDPRGRRLGHDPRARKDYHEVPRGNYDSGTGDVEGRELEVMQLRAGTYALDVIGIAAGRYDLAFYSSDTGGQSRETLELADVPTRAGLAHRYVLAWPAAASVPPRVAGGFRQGAGLLSYAYPLAPRTEVTDASATLVVFYAPVIVPGSFHATLGGRDVSARFHPAPDGHEVVSLPLAPGANPLVLSVRGALPDGRTVMHTDQLELVRR